MGPWKSLGTWWLPGGFLSENEWPKRLRLVSLVGANLSIYLYIYMCVYRPCKAEIRGNIFSQRPVVES